MIKGSIQEEDITLINIHAPHIGAPNYIKQIVTDIKGETDGNPIIVWDFNTLLTSMDRSSRQKINKAHWDPKWYNRIDLIDIFRTLHPKKKKHTQYIFFSSAHGTFSRIYHILGHKTSLNKFKSVEIISGIFSDHNDMKLGINQRKEMRIKRLHGD